MSAARLTVRAAVRICGWCAARCGRCRLPNRTSDWRRVAAAVLACTRELARHLHEQRWGRVRRRNAANAASCSAVMRAHCRSTPKAAQRLRALDEAALESERAIAAMMGGKRAAGSATNDASPRMFDGRDTIVIFDKLAYEDLLPVRWRPHAAAGRRRHRAAPRRTQPARTAGLRCARRTRPDSTNPTTNRRTRPICMRLDFKLNLLLDLAGQLLAASQPRLRPFTIRFNAMGASCTNDELLSEGAHGILEVTLRDIVVQPLNLPAQVVSGAPPGRDARAFPVARRNGRRSHREAGVSPPPAKNCRRAPASRVARP